MGGMPFVGVFLRVSSSYLHEFRRKPWKKCQIAVGKVPSIWNMIVRRSNTTHTAISDAFNYTAYQFRQKQEPLIFAKQLQSPK